MTPEAQQIAIAEACGWKVEPTMARGGWKLFCGDVAVSFWWNHDKTPTLLDVTHSLPDYLNDLNAMHEAEKVLIEQQQQVFLYQLHGEVVTYNNWHLVHTTAAQRAEAFLRTIGKWQDS